MVPKISGVPQIKLYKLRLSEEREAKLHPKFSASFGGRDMVYVCEVNYLFLQILNFPIPL